MAAAPVPAPPPPSVRKAKMLFNPSSLPVEVCMRYDDNVKGKLQTTMNYTPFYAADPYDGLRYWSDGSSDKTIFADGAVFFHVPTNEKVVLKNPVSCKKDTHTAVRRWYEMFGESLHNYGVFILFWLFHKNHGGNWVFSIGDTNMDDVPTNMGMTCLHSSDLIYQLLSQSSMFPPGSRLHDLVTQCYGDGYKALKAVTFKSHPTHHDQASTLCVTYPKQREMTLLEHLMTFKATPKDVDYSSIINPACQKIAICLDFVDKMEFKKSATGNIQFKLATPSLIYASLRVWLNKKEIETLALSSACIGELFDKNQYGAIGKVVTKQFKAEDKRQLDVMLHDMAETFKLTNRK